METARGRTKDLMTYNGWRAIAYRQILLDRPNFFEEIKNYSMLGVDPTLMGPMFNVEKETWTYWLKHSREMYDAIFAGTHAADAEVAIALHRRATGYEYTRQKVLVNKQGEGQVINLTEHIPPDTNAAKFWLTNRSPHNWRDRQSLEHTGRDGAPIDTEITINFVSPSSTAPAIEGAPANEDA